MCLYVHVFVYACAYVRARMYAYMHVHGKFSRKDSDAYVQGDENFLNSLEQLKLLVCSGCYNIIK